MDIGRGRNLLFGIFAVQLRGLLPEQLAGVSSAWISDPAVSLAERLVEKNLLSGEDKTALEKLVDEAVEAHGGDSSQLLALFGGEEQVGKVFFGGATSSYLRQMDTVPMMGGQDSLGSGLKSSGVSETPGRYTLVSQHARGGMGQVLIVHDEHLGRNIALKELMGCGGEDTENPTPMRQSASLIARFLQEARITSQLEHPAIVPVYELGRREDGTLYYTMRLVRGKTFAAALRECKGLDERLYLLSNFVSLCQAIAYAHSHRIIHRDIKPANVMLGPCGETVVLDWGLAKVHGAEDIHVDDIRDTLNSFGLDGECAQPMTVQGMALGTPHYMPPEQAAGNIEAIDERSDVYSLGAVLYEILTGKTPHSGKSTRDILNRVLHEASAPVLAVVPDAPPELAVICEKAVARDPSDRYQSATELAEEVERYVQGSLVRAYRYSLRQIVAHYYGRHRQLINTAVVTVVLLLAMGIGSYISILHARNREHEQRVLAEAARNSESIARRNESNARADAERKAYESQIHLAQAHIREKETGRAGELLWGTAEKLRGWEWRYLLTSANPEFYTVEVPDSNVFAAVFSPDGTRIGTNTHPEAPQIYDALSGKKLATLEGTGETYSQTAFSPDGTLYMGVSSEGAVNVWDAVSGKRLHRFPLKAQGYSAAFNASGNLLFIGAGDHKVHVLDLKQGSAVYELDMEAGAVITVATSPTKERMLATTPEGTGKLWDLATKAPLFSFTAAFPVFSPDGARIAALQGMDIVVLDAESGAESARLKGHTQRVWELRFSGDGKRLLSASQDGTVVLWDVVSSKPLQTYALPAKSPAIHAFFLSGERYVLASSADNEFVLLDAHTGSRISQTQGRGATLSIADLQPGGTLLAIASASHAFQVLNPLASTGVEAVIGALGSNESMSRSITSSLSGSLVGLFRTLNPESVWLLDTDQKKAMYSFSASYDCFPDLPALSEDGSRFAMVADGFVAAVISNPASPKPESVLFTGHSAPLSALALKADGKLAASGDEAGQVFLWNTESAQTVRQWKAHEGSVTRLQFSRDGERLLSCGLDGETVIWSCETGQKFQSLEHQAKGVVCASFNGDETRVLTVDVAGSVEMWDAGSGKSLGKATSGRSIAIANNSWSSVEASFWPGGNRFLTQYPGEGSLLWDATAMTPLLFFPTGERVLPLQDGECLASADREGNVRLTRMPGTTAGTALTRAEFGQYQATWASGNAVGGSGEPCPRQIFIGTEDLLRGINGLVQGANAVKQPQPAPFRVEAETQTQDSSAMELKAGDTILAVDDAAVADAATAEKALANCAARLRQNGQAGVSLLLSRNGVERRQSYCALPLKRGEAKVTLGRKEALSLVQFEIDRSTVQMDTEPETAWVSLAPLPEEEGVAKAHLTRLMVLTVPDGAAVNSIGSLRQGLIGLKQRIEAGGAVQFSQTFREGSYRESVRSFVVEGG